MHDFSIAIPPLAVMRGAISAVWLYEGLWCKILGRAQLQVQVVAAVRGVSPLFGHRFLKVLGAVEILLAAWALSGISPASCAIVQTTLLVVLNANGLLWARHVIHEPCGMIVKNIAFLVLVWTCGAIPGGRP